MYRILGWARNYAIGSRTINYVRAREFLRDLPLSAKQTVPKTIASAPVLVGEHLQSAKECAFGDPACGYLFTCFGELRFVSREYFVNVKLS